MSVLTDGDREILPLILRHNKGFHIGCKWYLDGWTPMPNQYSFHQTDIANMTFLAGIAAGKTTAVAASYLMDCISIPYFQGLNTSVTSYQAELVFEMVMAWIEGNPKLEHLIDDISLRPFPVITFKNFSSWHFRTMGKDARFIRGSEYDRINIDEGGLSYEDQSLKTLRGRLRGKRQDGTTRMARMDVTTSPTDAPWLRERFYKGDASHRSFDPQSYRSIRATIYENIHLTPEQIALMEKDYSDEMIDVELRAMFPDYGMSEFPKRHLDACEEIDLNDQMTLALRPESGKPLGGWVLQEHPRHGITHWEMPAEPNARYVMFGDPGTGDPPKRNAGVIAVVRTDRIPYDLVYFDWVFGRGAYSPFLQSYKYAIQKYHPLLKGIDSTGTQKAINELAFENYGIEVEGINFQRDKDAMLNSLSLSITDHQLRWPVIKGFRQMRQYRRIDDKRLAQDIVMTMAGVAFLCRYLPEEVQRNVERAKWGNSPNRKHRSRTSRKRRA